MTNEQIIFHERLSLMEEGVIKGTGRYITVEDENGEKRTIEIPEEIHTYAGWQALNRQVKKGQKSKVSINIWKHTEKKSKEAEEEGQGRMFLINAFFFTAEQTEPIEA